MGRTPLRVAARGRRRPCRRLGPGAFEGRGPRDRKGCQGGSPFSSLRRSNGAGDVAPSIMRRSV
eukprot:874744-Pyramimonas_sp.AAC.1